MPALPIIGAVATVASAGASVYTAVKSADAQDEAFKQQEEANKKALDIKHQETDALKKQADAAAEAASKSTMDTSTSTNMPVMVYSELTHALQSIANEKASENRDKAVPKDNILLYSMLALIFIVLIYKRR